MTPTVKQEFEKWYNGSDWRKGLPNFPNAYDCWDFREAIVRAYLAGRRAGLRAADKRIEKNVKEMSRCKEDFGEGA